MDAVARAALPPGRVQRGEIGVADQARQRAAVAGERGEQVDAAVPAARGDGDVGAQHANERGAARSRVAPGAAAVGELAGVRDRRAQQALRRAQRAIAHGGIGERIGRREERGAHRARRLAAVGASRKARLRSMVRVDASAALG